MVGVVDGSIVDLLLATGIVLLLVVVGNAGSTVGNAVGVALVMQLASL